MLIVDLIKYVPPWWEVDNMYIGEHKTCSDAFTSPQKQFHKSQHWFKSQFNNWCVSTIGQNQPALNIRDSTVLQNAQSLLHTESSKSSFTTGFTFVQSCTWVVLINAFLISFISKFEIQTTVSINALSTSYIYLLRVT